MEYQKTQYSPKNRNRFLKLSLKKNKVVNNDKTSRLRHSSSIIILDESLEQLKSDYSNKMFSGQKPISNSPIVIDDSIELSIEELPQVTLTPSGPSKAGNVSFSCSKEDFSIMDTRKPRPSTNGVWSPAQGIVCATPRHNTVPSTPKDKVNESLEQCSMKKIQKSQQKLLDDLYGEAWKSIPKLFKTISHKHDNFEGVSKKLFVDDGESDKENFRHQLKTNKELYLTASETKRNLQIDLNDMDKKYKKKLYTEMIPNTPEVPKIKSVTNTRNATTTVKKKKGMSVTELVDVMRRDVEVLAQKIERVAVTAPTDDTVKRISFVASLADNVPSWRCHTEALQYIDNYNRLREQLARRLYVEFNKGVFDDALDADMPITWDTKLRSTAGTTTNRLIRTPKGDRIRTSMIKLSTKVLDAPQRLRDTLVHELCHAATWVVDGVLKAGHGPLWKKWAKHALQVYPELGEISRCHDMQIHFKYSYKCTSCGYCIDRHSKSIDVTKKLCGYCRGTFEIVVNRKNKQGVVVSTPARKAGPNDFAKYVKENYAATKDGTKTHAQVMKILGEQFSSNKCKP